MEKNFVKNKSGHIAFKMKCKERLAISVVTTFVSQSKFYGDNTNIIIKDIKEIVEIDPAYLANLAIYARKEMNLRSISHVIVGELAQSINGKKYVRETINNVVLRVDDMTEILNYYINNYGKPIPNSMKKGLADKFITFDEHTLAKYNRNNDIKLKDIICLVHPKPKNKEQSDLFKRLIEGNMKTPITWETELSSNGNNKESWEKLIRSNKLGYMAILRNLRNIIKAAPENIDEIYNVIGNEERVIKSKQLPFRFYSAYKTLQNEHIGSDEIYSALERALEYSINNINGLKGKTFISTDVSGSMCWRISGNSQISSAEIATLMMSMANYICEESITTTFDTTFKIIDLPKTKGILENAKSIPIRGGGTDMSLPLKYLIDNKIYVDRIIIFSDYEVNCQYSRTMQSYIDLYRKEINKNLWVHGIDLQGYGTQQFKGKNVNIIAGWSEKVLEFIYKAEVGMDTLIETISKYYFNK